LWIVLTSVLRGLFLHCLFAAFSLYSWHSIKVYFIISFILTTVGTIERRIVGLWLAALFISVSMLFYSPFSFYRFLLIIILLYHIIRNFSTYMIEEDPKKRLKCSVWIKYSENWVKIWEIIFCLPWILLRSNYRAWLSFAFYFLYICLLIS